MLNLFDLQEAVGRLAGSDYSVPVFGPEAAPLLSRIEPVALHYELRVDPVAAEK